MSVTPLVTAAWLSVALGSVAVETDARLTARGRDVRVDGGGTRTTGELEAAPRVALVRRGRLGLSLSYAPRLTLPVDLSAGAPELESGAAVRDAGEVLHRGELTVDGAATPNLSLRLRGDAAYGRLDLLRSEIYADEVLPTAGRLAWRSARAGIEATGTPTRRITVSGGVGAFETGGADEEARASVALQRGGRLDAALRYGATRRDEISVVMNAAYSRFTPARDTEDAAIVRLGAGWARQLTPALAVRAASGAAWSYAVGPLAPAAREVAPYAEAAVSHAPGRPRVATDVALRLSPYMSPLTGEVDQRLEASISTAWRAARDWGLAARAAAAGTRSETSHGAFWTGERRAELVSLELRATWTFARRGTLSFVPRARRQWSHDPTVPTFVEWSAALELAGAARWPE